MAQAGYNPEEAVKFWERFSAATQGRSSGLQDLKWFRTHPLNEDRIRDLKSWLPEAKALYKPAR